MSFSIKPKDDVITTLPIKPALPLEQSSDEEESGEQSQPKDTHNAPPPNITPSTHESSTHSNGDSFLKSVPIVGSLNSSCTTDVEQSDSFIRDSILEQQQLADKKEAIRGTIDHFHFFIAYQLCLSIITCNISFVAENKVKDRLAQIAREKLGILSKEKQLQLERKRRAMAFLNQINGKSQKSLTSALFSN